MDLFVDLDDDVVGMDSGEDGRAAEDGGFDDDFSTGGWDELDADALKGAVEHAVKVGLAGGRDVVGVGVEVGEHAFDGFFLDVVYRRLRRSCCRSAVDFDERADQV